MCKTEAFDFKNLVPETILDSLSACGIRVDSGLMTLNSYENRVWQFSDEDKNRYVAKFYRPQRWSFEQLQEEHQFVAELAESEIPVFSAIPYQEKWLHNVNGYWFAIFPAMGGRQYETDIYEQLEAVGRWLGRLHQVNRSHLLVHRPTINLTEYFDEPFNIIAESAIVPSKLKNKILISLDTLGTCLHQVWRTDWQARRLHGDCHPSNILWRDGPVFVDFDDARNGPAVQDLWMLTSGTLEEQRVQWDILLESYTEFAEFDRNEMSLIEPLRTMRLVYYLGWILKRWQDPAFPAAFPWINEEDYWQRQLSVFAEQQQRLEKPDQLLYPHF